MDCSWYSLEDVGILARLAEVHNSKKVVILTVLRTSYSQVQWLLQIRQLQIRALIALFVSKSDNLQIRQGALFGSF